MTWIALEFGNSIYQRCIKWEGKGGDKTIFRSHDSFCGHACIEIYYGIAWGSVTLPLPSQMDRSFSNISTLSNDMNLYSVRVELRSLLLWGAGSLLASTSEAHWPASPNSCMSYCLIIMPLEGVMSFNHIRMSTSDRLSDPSFSCWMVVGTPSGLYYHKDSINCMLLGVSSLILKHRGFFDW